MDEDLKNSVLRKVADAEYRVERRRDKMLQGLEGLRETIETVLDNVGELPPGLGLLQDGDVILFGQSDGSHILGDPFIAATVGWTEPDEGAPYVTYNIQFLDEESSMEFTDLGEAAGEIAERVIEDVYKTADEKALSEASLPTNIVAAAQAEAAAGSAPPDAAAQIEFVWEGLNAQGETTHGVVKALSENSANDSLRKSGITPTKIVEKSKLPTT